MAKRTVKVEELLNGEADGADGASVSSFAVVPGAAKKNRIAEIAERAERSAREIPIVDRLGRGPKVERVAKPKAVREPKAPKELPFCGCGCGERTAGGKFLPGHDAKLKSRLFGEARSDDEEIRANALQQLSERNWLHLMGEKKVTPTADPRIALRRAIDKALHADSSGIEMETILEVLGELLSSAATE